MPLHAASLLFMTSQTTDLRFSAARQLLICIHNSLHEIFHATPKIKPLCPILFRGTYDAGSRVHKRLHNKSMSWRVARDYFFPTPLSSDHQPLIEQTSNQGNLGLPDENEALLGPISDKEIYTPHIIPTGTQDKVCCCCVVGTGLLRSLRGNRGNFRWPCRTRLPRQFIFVELLAR